MDEKTRSVLIQTAGFLTMLARGIIAAPAHVQKEASELLDKIGELIAANQG